MALIDFLRSNDLNFILAQVAGLITAVLAMVSVQLKDMKNILIMGVVTNALTVTNYWLLGEMSGAWICIIAIVQTLWIYHYTKNDRRFPKRLNYIFMVLYTAVVILTFGKAVDVLAWIAAIAFACAVVQIETSRYRLIIIVNSLSWVVYDLLTRSYTMAITHSLIFCSVVIAIIRLDRKQIVRDK